MTTMAVVVMRNIGDGDDYDSGDDGGDGDDGDDDGGGDEKDK